MRAAHQATARKWTQLSGCAVAHTCVSCKHAGVSQLKIFNGSP